MLVSIFTPFEKTLSFLYNFVTFIVSYYLKPTLYHNTPVPKRQGLVLRRTTNV